MEVRPPMNDDGLNNRHGLSLVSKHLGLWAKDLQASVSLLTRMPWPWQGRTSPFESNDSEDLIDTELDLIDKISPSDSRDESLDKENKTEKKYPIGRAVRAFPLIGIIIGLIAGIAFGLASGLGLPDLVAALIAVAISALLTGALHEDGLADTADGFGGGRSKKDKLALMRDSRIGAYGVLALLLVIAIKVGAISDFDTVGETMCALIAAAAASRAAMPALMCWMTPARVDGLSAAAGRPPRNHVITGIIIAIIISLILLNWTGLVALIAAAAGTLLVASIAQRQISGQTGDVLGATQQISELFFLLALAALS